MLKAHTLHVSQNHGALKLLGSTVHVENWGQVLFTGNKCFSTSALFRTQIELTSYLDLHDVLLNRAHPLPREGRPDLESDVGSDVCVVLIF